VFAAFNVHLFACIFYRVKDQYDDDLSVAQFYDARNVKMDVRNHAALDVGCELKKLSCVSLQDVVNKYVGSLFGFQGIMLNNSNLNSYFVIPFQLVCFYFVLTTFTTVGYGKHQQTNSFKTK
jgi:hypothetical protein